MSDPMMPAVLVCCLTLAVFALITWLGGIWD